MEVKGREVGGEPNGRVPSVSDRGRERRGEMGWRWVELGRGKLGCGRKKKKAELG
jgi:hypothetical protein